MHSPNQVAYMHNVTNNVTVTKLQNQFNFLGFFLLAQISS
jgi:hypothetical protein